MVREKNLISECIDELSDPHQIQNDDVFDVLKGFIR